MVELTKRCQGTVVQPGFVDKKWAKVGLLFFFPPRCFFGEIKGESKIKVVENKKTGFRISFKVMMIVPKMSRTSLIEL